MIIKENIIIAENGKLLQNINDCYIIATEIDLGIYDKAENWQEINEDEAPTKEV